MSAESLPPSPASGAAIGFFAATAPLTRVRWYFAPPGAKPLPHGTIFAGDDWDSDEERCVVEYGELPFAPDRKWNRGTPPPGVTGQAACGDADDFLHPHRAKSCCELTMACTCCTVICCNPFCGGLIGWCIGPNVTGSTSLLELTSLDVAPAIIELTSVPASVGTLELTTPLAGVGSLLLTGSDASPGLLELTQGPEIGVLELFGDGVTASVGMLQLTGGDVSLGLVELTTPPGTVREIELTGGWLDVGTVELVGDGVTFGGFVIAGMWVSTDTLIFLASAVVTIDDPSTGGGSASAAMGFLFGASAVVAFDAPSVGGGNASGPMGLLFGCTATVVTT